MKLFRKIFAIIVLFTCTQTVFGQDFQVPKDYSFTKNEDYDKYEKDIINCINWLEKTPVNEQVEKRKQASAFFIVWLTGSPKVTIEVNVKIVNFTKKNPALLITFMGGWTRLVLENSGSQQTAIKGNLAGIKSVIKVYKMGNGIKKDKNIEKLIALDASGELEKWIEDQMKQ